MPARSWDPLLSIITAVTILLAPFLVAGGGLMIGLGAYRVFHPAPRGEAAGVGSAVDLVTGAWPMLVAGAVATGVGIFAYRTLRQRNPKVPSTDKQKGADEVIPSAP